MQPRLTTLTLNGRHNIEESLPGTWNTYHEQPNTTKKSKYHSHDLYKRHDDSYQDNKYSSFSRFNNPELKASYNSFATQANINYQHNDERHTTIDSNGKYQSNKTARPKPLQYENRKYYDLVFPKKRDSLSTDIFYRSNYYLEYAEL